MKNGFTLLEVLIALLAAALISIMSFDFLSNTIFLKERIDNSISNNSKHSKAIHLMRLDMIQAIPFELKDQNFNKLNKQIIYLSLIFIFSDHFFFGIINFPFLLNFFLNLLEIVHIVTFSNFSEK